MDKEISFGIWLTGHDRETVEQLYNDYYKGAARESLSSCAGVMQKIAEAFERYLRSEKEYPNINWSDEKITQFDDDKKYRKEIYMDNRIKFSFGYAADLARTKLFEKIIKETLDSNFSE